MALLDSNLALFAFAAITLWMVLGSLRVIGHEYYRAVRWHNLRVQVQTMQRDQRIRTAQLEAQEASGSFRLPRPARPRRQAGATMPSIETATPVADTAAAALEAGEIVEAMPAAA